MNIMRKWIYILGVVTALSACSDYLNIVPDNTVTLEDYFTNREMAYNALAKVYSYLPPIHSAYNSTFLLGDEWMSREEDKNDLWRQPPMGIMMGGQNNSNPMYGLWTGSGGAPHLYKAIRTCNTFLDNISLATNMSGTEMRDWIAQVKFLKAYYHYQLVEYYGPIVIVDRSVNVDEPDEQILPKRRKIEDCFNYIIKLIDEAIPDLQDRVSDINLGMVDKRAALAIKARIMLLRASPFFNGNREYYGDFLDFDGQPFFPLDENIQKWKDALDAVNTAITFCENNFVELYRFTGIPFSKEDEALLKQNPENMQNYYSVKMVIPDPWNQELIWGRVGDRYGGDFLQYASAIRTINENDPDWQNTWGVGNWLGANYSMLERYYTQNGLPLDVDMTFSQSDKYELFATPDASDASYKPWAGILQPDVRTVSLYLGREMRFYANLGVTGGYWRQYQRIMPTMMLPGTDGGISFSHGGTGEIDYFWTGIGVQKFVHPESTNGFYQRMITFPYPVIRLADLYLMKAEILNEIEGPNQAVYDELNKIRRRAGIPDVEDAWSNPVLVSSNYINSHKDKNKLREIILRERSIELAFEGARFFDMRRYKRAMREFNQSTMGWNGKGSTAGRFFVLSIKQRRSFQMRDNLWPIPLSEMNINSNLKQNPGWPGSEKK
ncbi:starch-binding protein [Bacteroidia bacterium]|nr:starch-binding protein [Bacteroidia bacterium]